MDREGGVSLYIHFLNKRLIYADRTGQQKFKMFATAASTKATFLSKFTIFEKLISSKMHTGDLFLSLCTFTHTTPPEKHKELNNRHLLTSFLSS